MTLSLSHLDYLISVFKNVAGQFRERGLISGKSHFMDSGIIKAGAANISYHACLMPLSEYLERIRETEEQDIAFQGLIDLEKMGGRCKRIGEKTSSDYRSRCGVDLETRQGVPLS
jgi:hypothetical protein